MIKRDPTLIFLPGSHCWSEEDLWKVGMEWSCCLAVMDAATKTEKKKKKCSSAVPSGFFVDAQRVIFSVDLVNSYFCSPPTPALRFAVQVK